MSKRSKMLLVGAAVLAVGGGATAVAIGSGSGENDAAEQVTGAGADQARAAGLAITSGGTANSVERDSAHGATWEVEITKPDGNTVDVYLDESYQHVATEGDSESHDTSN